jgi:hypothetical protein
MALRSYFYRTKRTQLIGGRCVEMVCQVSSWFSETQADPVVESNANRFPVSSTLKIRSENDLWHTTFYLSRL